MEPSTYSLSPDEQLVRACELFQQAIVRGNRPRIEEYLIAVNPQQRHPLLVSLLILELKRETDLGNNPQLDAALIRFKGYEAAVHEAWNQYQEEFTMRDHQTGRPASSTRVIGRYKLLEKIGEGGMGEVWRAEQLQPFRRQVAIKLIKSQSPSKDIIARFELERQALAIMNHPNLAKILDAGETENGQPYFVMDLVQGIPITEYCNLNRLSPQERLKLFIPVCHAIQHAHHKGIIHRDIKPSNVLITLCDGQPVAKVIDFGLAKAMQPQHPLSDKTLFTEFGRVVGTLQYMSPEQAELNTLDIDTRTDIYSLGVLLYELLTGTTPLQQDSIRHDAILTVLEMIRREDPPTPSQRLSGSSDAIDEILNERRIDSTDFHRILKGDLDWIVMKALEKDRTRRYETASGLADDIGRFLQHEPVLARSPSLAYRLRKFARKHRAAFAAGIAIASCLLLGTIVATGLSIWALAERNQANRHAQEAQAADKAKAVELKRISLLLYANQIDDAQREWNEGHIRIARSHLENCSPDFRNWEYRYLKNRFLREHPTIDSDDVRCARYSPDGQQIVVGTFEGLIKVLDASNHKPLAGLTFGQLGKDRIVLDVAYSPDSKRIVTSHYNGQLKLWNATNGLELWSIQRSRHSKVAFSPDGKLLASGFDGGTSKVWDAETGTERQTLTGHSTSVNRVAFSPDGRWMATACDDGTMKVWESASGSELRTLQGHTSAVNDLAFSPDGTRLISASDDHTLRIWDTSTGQTLHMLDGHAAEVASAQFSPDGRQIASGSVDRTVRLWDANNGQELRAFRAHDLGVHCIDFARDGKRILSAANELKLLNAESPTANTMKEHVAPLSFLTFSPDSQRLLSGDVSGCIKSWDINSRQLLRSISSNEGTNITYSATGNWMAWQNDEVSLQTWDLPKQQIVHEIKLHSSDASTRSTFIAISPDGQQIASDIGDQLKVWDARSGLEIRSWDKTSHGIDAICFCAEPNRFVSYDDNAQFRLWDVTTGSVIRPLVGTSSPITSFACSPTTATLACSHANRTMTIWDLKTGERKHSRSLPVPATAIDFSPDGQQLVSGHESLGIMLWDVENGRQLLTLDDSRRTDEEVSQVAFSPDSKRVAVGDRLGFVKVWDIAQQKLITSVRSNPNSMGELSFGNDGHWIVSGNSKGIQVLETDTGRELFKLDGAKIATARLSPWMAIAKNVYPVTVSDTTKLSPPKTIECADRHLQDGFAISPDGRFTATALSPRGLEIRDVTSGKVTATTNDFCPSIAFSPDSKWIAVPHFGDTLHVLEVPSGKMILEIDEPDQMLRVFYSSDGTKLITTHSDHSIELRNASDGKKLMTFRGHTSEVHSVAMSPDGTRLVSGSLDATMKVWDVTYGIEIMTLRGHQAGVKSLTFSPDGTKIASGSDDGGIHIWDAGSSAN